jgi:hypothetical protein
MPSANLVGYSNLALYSAMGVFTVSMLLFAAYLAALGPVRNERVSSSRNRELVVAGGAVQDAGGAPSRIQAPGAPADEPSPRARKTANIALSLAWLGSLLLVASVVLRGLAVMRPPWGNMFEFATAGCRWRRWGTARWRGAGAGSGSGCS